MFNRRLALSSNTKCKLNSTMQAIPSPSCLRSMNFPADNSGANQAISGWTCPAKLDRKQGQEDLYPKAQYSLCPPNKKARLCPLRHSSSLPTAQPAMVNNADVPDINVLNLLHKSHFQVPRVHLEKMDFSEHGKPRPTDAVLLEEGEASPAPMLSNASSAPALASWMCKNVVHGCDTQQKDEVVGVSVTQSTANCKAELEPIMQHSGLTAEILIKAFNHLQIAMNLFKTHDTDMKRSCTVSNNIVKDYACYTEMLKEKEKISQQATFNVPKAVPKACIDAGKTNLKQQSGYTFKAVPQGVSDNSAVSKVPLPKGTSATSLAALPMDVKAISTVSRKANASVGAFGSSLSEGQSAGSAVPRNKSTSELEETCPKAPLGPQTKSSQGTAKVHQAQDPFDAEKITSQNPIIVYFDLETTGLSYSHEIVQVSCVCSCLEAEGNSANFNVYAMPRGDFDPMASAVTNLTKQNKSIYWNGKKMPSVSLEECLRELVFWLQRLPGPALLVGHNSRRFDAPRLLLALWNCNLLHAFQLAVWGFADSFQFAKTTDPRQHSYRLEDLSATLCPSSLGLSAHNALNDCLILEQVVHALAQIQPERPRCGPQANGVAASNMPGTKHDSTSSAPAAVQAQPASSAHCAEKTRLLKALQAFVFTTQSVMVALNRSRSGQARLSPSGS